MRLPCVNPQCSQNCRRHGLCDLCRHMMIRRLVPTCGMIPSPALSMIARELLVDLAPTQSELTEALRFMRGPRHREGLWQDRPVYSAAVLHANPTAPMKRRLPELLVGRRSQPTATAILAAGIHFILAQHVLGLDKRTALYLAGASYFVRRATVRPKGVRREYMGKIVSNTHRLRFFEFVAIGRLVLRAAGVLGLNERSHSVQLTTRYLLGVEAGEFNKPIVVHPACGVTTSAGDHPLDHFLPRQDFAPNLPQYGSKIRRASGKIAGSDVYPLGLDVSLEEQLEAKRQANVDRFKSTQVKTTKPPSTDWLFPD